LKKYDLQESYNNFKIKLKIFFVNRTPGFSFKNCSRHKASISISNLHQQYIIKNIDTQEHQEYIFLINVEYSLSLEQGRHFSFFQGGQHFDRLTRGRGRAKYEETINCVQKQKITIFQIQGGGQMSPPKCHPCLEG